MRVVIQRCLEARVVSEEIDNHINKGLSILVGFTEGDTLDDIKYLVNKIVNLRIFDDAEGIMNLSIQDINGEILSISQFTLYATTIKGNRPSYNKALKSSDAILLYNEFNNELNKFVTVKTGNFGHHMEISLKNDGPVTIVIDSKNRDL